MTTQNASTAEAKGFDPDEAERLASMIRPAWEMDDDSESAVVSAKAGVIEPAKAEPAKAEPAKAEPAKAEPAKAEPAKADVTTIEIPRAELPKTAGTNANEPKIVVSALAPVAGSLKAGDTLIDSGPRFSDASADPVKPLGAKATQLGLGDEDATEAMDDVRGGSIAAAAKALSAQLEASQGAPSSRAPAAEPSSDSGLKKALTRTLAIEAAPLAPAGAAGPASGATRPSVSRADDPVEIPVRKSSVGLFVGVGAAAVLLLGLGGYAIFGGSSNATDKAKPTATTTAVPKESPKPTATATAAQTAAPVPDATPTATPTVTATVTATATASAAPTAATPEPAKTTAPVATATTPPKPTATNKPTATPQPTGTTKPGSGGIIREVPF